MDDIQLPSFRTVRIELVDTGYGNTKQPVTVFVSPLGIGIQPEGHSDHATTEGQGTPVFVLFRDGEVEVMVKGDINQENPTHHVSLAGAREICRHARNEEVS